MGERLLGRSGSCTERPPSFFTMAVTSIKAFPIPIPPPAEQAAVAARCAEQFKAINAGEMRRAAAVEQIDRLGQSILAKAFRGELLPLTEEP